MEEGYADIESPKKGKKVFEVLDSAYLTNRHMLI